MVDIVLYCTMFVFGYVWQALLWKPLPSLVFGVFAAVSGVLYMCLPETLGHVLPDTIEEAEAFGHRHQPPLE